MREGVDLKGGCMKNKFEIMLGLKCCEESGHVCRVCPYCKSYKEEAPDYLPETECNCAELHKDAQELINDLEKRIEDLRTDCAAYAFATLKYFSKSQKKSNEFHKHVDEYKKMMKQVDQEKDENLLRDTLGADHVEVDND
jgi:hypothetical protein